MRAQGIGGDAGDHQGPTDGMQFGGHEGDDLGFVEMFARESIDLSGIGIGQEPGMHPGKQPKSSIGSEHMLCSIGTIRHLLGNRQRQALQDAVRTGGGLKHIHLSKIDKEVGANKLIDALLEFVERLAIDIVGNLGNSRLFPTKVRMSSLLSRSKLLFSLYSLATFTDKGLHRQAFIF